MFPLILVVSGGLSRWIRRMHMTHNFAVAPFYGGGMAVVVAGKEGF